MYKQIQMERKYNSILNEEQLREENEILKMKLLAEHGSIFEYGVKERNIPAEIEYVFLQQVLDFEQQEAVAKEMSVFEVLGSPQHFPSVEEMSEERCKEMLLELLHLMLTKQIQFDVLRPNVSHVEIYRFLTEELFKHRMLHIVLPGMTTNFIYDEFHPDYGFDNANIAVNDCLRQIFSTKELQWTFHFDHKLQLNQTPNLKIEVFRNKINVFKQKFENIEPLHFNVLQTDLSKTACTIIGTYEICFSKGGKHWLKTGQWTIQFRFWDELDIWMIFNIQVEGIVF